MYKRSYDIIMIIIIIIAALNYAGYIKVDMNLMMLLVTIALYTSSTQKSNQKTQHSQKVEPLDGSTVAFDKEAFVNLNKIVNELVKKDQVTIPGNLIVMGKTTFEDVTTVKKDLNVHTSVNVGTDDNNAIRVRQNRIGTKGCGEIEFHPTDGWLRHYTYGTDNYRAGCGFAAGALYSSGNSTVVGSLTVSGSITSDNDITAKSSLSAGQNLIVGGATTLKGTLNVTGQTTCNTTTISGLTVTGTTTLKNTLNVTGDIKASGNAYANAYLYKNNGNQGLLFNQGDRQIRLASGTSGAMLDFDKKIGNWFMGWSDNNYIEFDIRSLCYKRTYDNDGHACAMFS